MSKKGLVIVESPAKAKTISKYLQNQYNVSSSVGHIIDLPEKELGVDIENNFEPKYVKMPGKTKVINQLRKLAKDADSVYIATDPDREGEAIAFHIRNVLQNVNKKIHRVTFNEITKNAVAEAMLHPRDIDEKMVNAQQARRILDRIVGYKISPFLWKTITKGLSAGRVQSVALRLVCEREAEIQAFKPEEYWNIFVHLNTPDKETFSARLSKINGKKAKIPNKEKADFILADLDSKSFVVLEKNVKQIKRSPYPPFTTSTLQQSANRLLGMSAKRTMAVAQQLYEGIELNGETIGLITYMRTDSLRVSKEAVGNARSFIYDNYGDDYLPEKPNYYRSKKSAQDAHEAIRPTQIYAKYAPKTVKKYLGRDQFRLYELIWNRFIASQMVPAKVEKTVVVVGGYDSPEDKSKPYQFQAEGEVIRFRGFLQVFEDKEEENGKDEKPSKIPAHISVGMPLKLIKPEGKQMFTSPPPRYTESSLVKTLDQLGIGRPSTYAQIISTILQRKYVEIKEKKLHATELGMTVNKILVENFPDIFNVEFTAFMESELDKIAAGDLTYLQAMELFFDPFSKALEKANTNRKEIKASIQEDSGITCEKCGRPMIIKWGRNGKFLACSGFPECKNTRPLEEDQPRETEHKCPACGAPMVLKKGRYGNFLACSNYPKCKTTMPVPTGVKCPKKGCDGEIVQRQTKRGKIFYGCSNYPKCDFATWDKPVAIECPVCENSYLLEKNTKAKGRHYVCPSCKTTFNPEDLAHEKSA